MPYFCVFLLTTYKIHSCPNIPQAEYSTASWTSLSSNPQIAFPLNKGHHIELFYFVICDGYCLTQTQSFCFSLGVPDIGTLWHHFFFSLHWLPVDSHNEEISRETTQLMRRKRLPHSSMFADRISVSPVQYFILGIAIGPASLPHSLNQPNHTLHRSQDQLSLNLMQRSVSSCSISNNQTMAPLRAWVPRISGSAKFLNSDDPTYALITPVQEVVAALNSLS